HPSQAASCNALAWIYACGPLSVRDPAKALPMAQKAVALAPGDLAYQTTLGAAYYRLGKFDKAAETLRTAARANPARGLETINGLMLAMSYYQLGEVDKAKECFAQAALGSPQDGLNAQTLKELQALRAEASGLLGVEPAAGP